MYSKAKHVQEYMKCTSMHKNVSKCIKMYNMQKKFFALSQVAVLACETCKKHTYIHTYIHAYI